MGERVADELAGAEASDKFGTLNGILCSMGSVLVAFSGGVDSTFLLAVAKEALPRERLLAVTASSLSFPEREVREAKHLAALLAVEHVLIHSNELENPAFRKNPVDRCYICKKELFSQLKEIAEMRKIPWIVEGSTIDDLSDHRPARRAIAELGIRSPLLEAGLEKTEIRRLSGQLDLPTCDKPSFACLASRFPYGEPISEKGLRIVDLAEQFLLGLGFGTVRVRSHGQIARIEVSSGDLGRLLKSELRQQVIRTLKSVVYTYVALDLEGYRSGSMNEPIRKGIDGPCVRGTSRCKGRARNAPDIR